MAAAWAQQRQPVVGITQSAARHDALRQHGIEPYVGSAADWLTSEDALLFSLPGNANQKAAVEALANTPVPIRAVLISSTGYYGTPQGRVNEETPRGETSHAIAVEAAELAFRAWAGERGVVLRLGGLYRRGRGPMSALLRRGAAPPGPPNRTLSLIHYADAASASLAALQHTDPEATYVGVVTPCPTRLDFYLRACQLAGLPEPDFDAALAHAPADYDVTRMRRDLLPQPAHPDWRDALKL